MAQEPTGWFPVFTLLLGYAVKVATDWVQHRRTLERERDARQAQRRDLLSERRSDFQRQTLLDLQEAVMDVARTTGAMHHEDQMAYHNTRNWGRQLYAPDLDERNSAAMRRTSMLAVRVRDESVRDLVQRFKSHSANATTRRSREESESEMAEMATVFENLNYRIGEILRRIDEEPEGHQS